MIDVDFNKSMGIYCAKKYGFEYPTKQSRNHLKFATELYKANKPSIAKYTKKSKIPKIIHQIWLGNSPIPNSHLYYQHTWKRNHPDWQYKLWTDKDLENWRFGSKTLYNKARGYQERADILKYEILQKYGGMCVDLDHECFEPFDELVHKYKFFIAATPPALNSKRFSLSNGIIASAPEHPILAKALENIANNWSSIEEDFDKNKSTKGNKFYKSPLNLAIHRTNYAIDDAFFKLVTLKDKDIIILPSGYCQPLYFYNKHPLLNTLSKIVRGRTKLYRRTAFQDETMSASYSNTKYSLIERQSFFNSMFEDSYVMGRLYKYIFGNKKNRFVFEKLYDNFFPSTIHYNINSIIPKTIHQIWISNNPLPKRFQTIKEAWERNHPGWKYQLWTPKELKEFTDESPDIYDHIPDKYKYTALSYEIINKYGGVYASFNTKPLKNFDELNNKYDFYTGLPPLTGLNQDIFAGNDIFASRPDHVILKNTIDSMKADYKAFTKANADEVENFTYAWDDALQSTLTENIYRYHMLDGKNIAFPATYFYPSEDNTDNAFCVVKQ